ncbi:hypothetical protein GCM10027075_63490 [Streptomyces heilongjiangensis]
MPADREREEAEPYVRAAHAGRCRAVAGSLGDVSPAGGPRLPLRVTLVHGSSRSINRPARRDAAPEVKPGKPRNHSEWCNPATPVGYLTTTLNDVLCPLSQSAIGARGQ